MKFTPIAPNQKDDVIKHLTKNFLHDEPLSRAAKMSSDSYDFKNLVRETMMDNLSLIALNEETGEVAGVGLNCVICPGDMESGQKQAELYEDQNFKKIFRLLYHHNLKTNLFNIFNVDKIFEIRIISVDPKFRGQGIAKKLVDEAIALAKKENFKLIKSDATGVYSQMILKKSGFKVYSELSYKDYIDLTGSPIIEVDEPHKSLQLMYKYLEH